MEIRDIRAAYFIGAGGIGMSAIARYFLHRGVAVAGYDGTRTALTDRLAEEGMPIHYEDDVRLVPCACRKRDSTLVVYTPAVPESHGELRYFRDNGFEVAKRAQVLGMITRELKALCVAGTHGKTTTSAMCAHIMHPSTVGCNAFLGGISKNLGSNYVLDAESEYVVIEADEFDRSFHWLRPWVSVITATDADHLDVYGTHEAYLESFRHYTTLIRPGGALVIHEGLALRPDVADGVSVYTYGVDTGDFHAGNVRTGGGEIVFDFVSPLGGVRDVRLGQPLTVNIANGVAAMAMAQLAGCAAGDLACGMATFKGVDRRFDFRIRTDGLVLLSDYAHHPEEVRQCAVSLRNLYGDRRITAVFQPHLYTRTRDFHRAFADSLALFDEVVLCDIYPARESPIEGVTSKLIQDDLPPGVKSSLVSTSDVLDFVRDADLDVLVILGAGDLDGRMQEIEDILKGRLG